MRAGSWCIYIYSSFSLFFSKIASISKLICLSEVLSVEWLKYIRIILHRIAFEFTWSHLYKRHPTWKQPAPGFCVVLSGPHHHDSSAPGPPSTWQIVFRDYPGSSLLTALNFTLKIDNWNCSALQETYTQAERTIVWYKEQLCQTGHKQMSPTRQQQNNNCTLFGIIMLWSFQFGLILHIICSRSSFAKPLMLEGTTQKLTKQTKKYNINTNMANSSQCAIIYFAKQEQWKENWESMFLYSVCFSPT